MKDKIITAFNEVLKCGEQNIHYGSDYRNDHHVIIHGGSITVKYLQEIIRKINAIDIGMYPTKNSGIKFIIIFV